MNKQAHRWGLGLRANSQLGSNLTFIQNPDSFQLLVTDPAKEGGLPLTQRPLVRLENLQIWDILDFQVPLWNQRPAPTKLM